MISQVADQVAHSRAGPPRYCLINKIMIIFPPFDAPTRWRAVDDRIRGGSSTSHMEPIRHDSEQEQCDGVRFYGELGMSPDTRVSQ